MMVNILYSLDIDKPSIKILEYKKNRLIFRDFMILNNKIFLFINSFYLKFLISGDK